MDYVKGILCGLAAIFFSNAGFKTRVAGDATLMEWSSQSMKTMHFNGSGAGFLGL